jgi:hypothetical protein
MVATSSTKRSAPTSDGCSKKRKIQCERGISDGEPRKKLAFTAATMKKLVSTVSDMFLMTLEIPTNENKIKCVKIKITIN